MKILGTVIGEAEKTTYIKGFIVQGSKEEFSQYPCWVNRGEEQVILNYFGLEGHLDRSKVRIVASQDLFATNFENGQLRMSGNNVPENIEEKGKFKLNKLPVILFAHGKPKFVVNQLHIVSRVVSGNKSMGFCVEMQGDMPGFKVMTYAEVIRYSKVYKLANFIISWKDGKPNFVGKPGWSLAALPQVDLSIIHTYIPLVEFARESGYKGVSTSSFSELYSALILLQELSPSKLDTILDLHLTPSDVVTSLMRSGVLSGTYKSLLELYEWVDEHLPIIAKDNNWPTGEIENMADFFCFETDNMTLAFAVACYIFGRKDKDKIINSLFSVSGLAQKFSSQAVMFMRHFNSYVLRYGQEGQSRFLKKRDKPTKVFDIKMSFSLFDEFGE